MSDELVVVGGELATMANPPEAVLAEAQGAAVALQGVISQKPKKVVMGGEQYLEFEDWQTLGRFYGITAGEEKEPEFVEFGEVRGFKATSVALRGDKVISRATAFCMTDEEKWGQRTKYEYHMALEAGGTAREEESDKNEWVWEDNPKKEGKRPKRIRVAAGVESVPLFQLASMAQTRANAKVLRNVLSWVAVLAGYRPTPAEEMSDAKTVDAEVVEPKKRGKAGAKGTPKKAQAEIEAAARAGCPHCGSANVVVEASGNSAHCEDCAKGWNLEK